MAYLLGAVPRIVAVLGLLVTLTAIRSAVAQPLEWTQHGAVAEGTQFDAVKGPDGRVHLISSRYYALASDGTVLGDEDPGDGHHGDLDFPPAIAVGADGAVHVVTRHDGDFEGGNDIRYRRRNAGGSWDLDYLIGSRERRNYVVGVTTVGSRVIAAYTSAGDNVWGDIRLWEAGEDSASALGNLSGIWRADTGIRLRTSGDRLFLASGVCDPDGRAYLLHGDAGGDLVGTLAANTWEHHEGSGRRGFVDLFVDAGGQAHLTYGAEQTVHYNRYDPAGDRVFATDVQIGSGLGEWHMSIGLSAVGASDDGQTVVAVMLLSDGSQSASNSDLLWTYSLDGGASWTDPTDLGVNTSGGEGRLLPRIVAVGGDFLLFYKDVGSGSISLMTMYVEPDDPGDDDDTAGDDDDTADDDDDTAGDDDVTGDDDATGDDDVADDDGSPPGSGDGGCECALANDGCAPQNLALLVLFVLGILNHRRWRHRV